MLLSIIFAIVLVIGACSPPAPMSDVLEDAVEVPEEPAEEDAAEAPEEPAEPAEVGATGPITVANMQGIAPGKYPTQFELAEFEAATGAEMSFTGRTSFDPMLTDIFGDFPSDVNDRFPE